MSSTSPEAPAQSTSPPAPDPAPSTAPHVPAQSAGPANVPRFAIRPSHLLRSPVVKRPKKLMSGLLQDRRMHLMADQYKTRRQQALSKNTRLRAEAETSHQSKYQYELKVLLYAAERGFEWTGLDGQLALALAKAVRDTLIAEEEVMDRRIYECRSLLSTLEDSKDDAKGRALEASYQVESVVNYLKRMGLQEPPPLLLEKEGEEEEDAQWESSSSEISCESDSADLDSEKEDQMGL